MCILWEPYAGGPNIATGPVGSEALFKAFKDSPHVGLQFDPSHLVWRFMNRCPTRLLRCSAHTGSPRGPGFAEWAITQ